MLQEDNRGSQMLVGMGWQQAQDIGARQHSMLPFTLTQRKRFAGLGAKYEVPTVAPAAIVEQMAA